MGLNRPIKIALLALHVGGAGVAAVASVGFPDAGRMLRRRAVGDLAQDPERETTIRAARSASGPSREFRP